MPRVCMPKILILKILIPKILILKILRPKFVLGLQKYLELRQKNLITGLIAPHSESLIFSHQNIY